MIALLINLLIWIIILVIIFKVFELVLTALGIAIPHPIRVLLVALLLLLILVQFLGVVGLYSPVFPLIYTR